MKSHTVSSHNETVPGDERRLGPVLLALPGIEFDTEIDSGALGPITHTRRLHLRMRPQAKWCNQEQAC